MFLPRDEASLDQYNQYPKITEIFPMNCLGFQTHRDDLVIDIDKDNLKRRIAMFRDAKMPDDLIGQTFGLAENQAWDMSSRRRSIVADKDWKEKIVPCLYRPFDTRWIFYHDAVVDRPRKEVMRHMMQSNLALNAVRQTKMSEWRHAVVSNLMAPAVYVEIKDGSNLFPLYLYPDKD